MKRKTYNKLSAKDKLAVQAVFPDAADGDGQWYHLHEGKVLKRTKNGKVCLGDRYHHIEVVVDNRSGK